MGQVPDTSHLYGIVGDGRLATHIRAYFDYLHIPYVSWSRRTHPGIEPEIVLEMCATILLLINDDSILPFIETQKNLHDKTFVHCSGALVLPNVQGVHPLMTFGPKTYDLCIYQQIPFVWEKGKVPFQQLFPELRNLNYSIAPETKVLYHSLCVMAGNFTTLLWSKFFHELEEKFHMPAATAFPYLRAIANNLEADYNQALTGPIVRKDWATMDRNMEALEGDPYQAIYRAFVEVVAK